MGYSTTYLGRLDIEPPLNPAETEWLRAFRLTDRSLHPDDPYAVPMNPRHRAPGGAGSELVEIIRRGRARPTLDHRPEGEILGYDAKGSPGASRKVVRWPGQGHFG